MIQVPNPPPSEILNSEICLSFCFPEPPDALPHPCLKWPYLENALDPLGGSRRRPVPLHRSMMFVTAHLGQRCTQGPNAMQNLASIQSYMREQRIDAWLVYDFRGNNSVLAALLPGKRWTTRRVMMLIPAEGSPRAGHLDADRDRVG